MSVTTTPGKGVKISLNEYARLQVSRTGPDFWYIDNQKPLREKLAPFLPRMDYNPSDNSVTAQQIESGKEKLGDSVAANPDFSNVPAEQVRKLRSVIAGFQQELSELPTSSPLGRLGEAFTLPIPSKAPELYRLYGTGKNKKLAIIWGVSKTDSAGNEDINSVATLQQMLHILPNPRKENPVVMFITNAIETIVKLPRNAKLILLGVLVALIVLLSWVCCGSGNETGAAIPQATDTQQYTPAQQGNNVPQYTTPAQQGNNVPQYTTPAQQGNNVPQYTPTQQGNNVPRPTSSPQPISKLSVSNFPCDVAVKEIKQVNDGRIHITFIVTPKNGIMPYKVFIDNQEVKNGNITLGYRRYPTKICVSTIMAEGAEPNKAELTINQY